MFSSASLISASVMATLLCTACAPLRPQVAVPPEPPVPVIIYVPSLAPEDLASRQLLTYQAVLAKMNQADLAREIGRAGDGTGSLADTMKLALALGYTHVGSDVERAQGLLDKVLSSSGVEAQAWHGLARLLSAGYAEQRRAQEQIDRLNQQLRDTQRDNQRKLDQLNDKLDALKSIERSINNRVPAAPGPFISAPASPPAPSAPLPKPASRP